MTQLEQVLQTVLALPPEDRAIVVAALEQSLGAGLTPIEAAVAGSPTASSQELLNELERRWEAYVSGKTTARLAADVIADLYREQAAEESK